MTTTLFASLHEYYDRAGIGAKHFACKHYAECLGTSEHFSTAKEAYVGERFGMDGLPRLVFLSLDSGDGGEQWHETSEQAAEARTLEALQKHENRVDVATLPKGRHWYQTREMALTLLGPLKAGLDVSAVHQYFAHTNSAKCCLNKPRRAEADRRLFDNCRAFIPGELEILAPAILVTQGDWAKVAVSAGFASKTSEKQVAASGAGAYHLISLAGPDSTVWLHSYHPASRGGYYGAQVKQDWKPWSDVIRKRFGG